MFYSVGAPECVQEREAELEAVEQERRAAREHRAARLEAFLAGTTGEADGEEGDDAVVSAGEHHGDGAGEDGDGAENGIDAPAAPRTQRGCVPASPHRQAAAAAAASAFLRAHEAADSVGFSDAVLQAFHATVMLRNASADALQAGRDAASRVKTALGRAIATRGSATSPDDQLDGVGSEPPPSSTCPEHITAAECKDAGNTAYRAGRFEAALRAYTRACDLHPGVAAYHANRGAALAALHRPKDAVAAYVTALACDGSHGRASRRLVELTVDNDALSEAQAAAETVSGDAGRKLAAVLRAVNGARKDAKAAFQEKRYAQAEAIYTKAMQPPTDGDVRFEQHVCGLPGAVVLLCNRASCRAAQGNHSGALEDSELALALAPHHAKAVAHRDAAVRAMNAGVQDAASKARDGVVAELRSRGIAVLEPWQYPQFGGPSAAAIAAALDDPAASAGSALPVGRMQCAVCLADGRDPVACRAGLRHTAPDADIDTYRVGGRVRLRRAVAVQTQGVALGPTARGGTGNGEPGVVYEVGIITAFDWRTGMHTVTRDAGGGTLHVRLINVRKEDVQYDPPQVPQLAGR